MNIEGKMKITIENSEVSILLKRFPSPFRYTFYNFTFDVRFLKFTPWINVGTLFSKDIDIGCHVTSWPKHVPANRSLVFLRHPLVTIS
ncbi:hypothetical protein ANTQUA_LOCUS8980 [Anthophora quadrimaculata]